MKVIILSFHAINNSNQGPENYLIRRAVTKGISAISVVCYINAMLIKHIASGVAHDLPGDLASALLADESALERWQDLTPLARNEWICWVISNKKSETRQKHVERTITELLEGMRRPCCWQGCKHR